MENVCTCSDDNTSNIKEPQSIQNNADTPKKPQSLNTPNIIDTNNTSKPPTDKNMDKEINDILFQIINFHLIQKDGQVITSRERELYDICKSNSIKNINEWMTISHENHNQNSACDNLHLKILNLLTEKIGSNLHIFFNKLIAVDDIKQLSEVYEESFPDSDEKSKKCHSHPNSRHHCCKCHSRLCKEHVKEEEVKVAILLQFKAFFIYLHRMFHSIITSSKDIEEVFEEPLKCMTKGKTPFNFQDIIKEDFIKVTGETHWVKKVSQKIFNAARKVDNTDIEYLVSIINEIMISSSSEMTRFKEAVNDEINRCKYLRGEYGKLDDLLMYINSGDKSSKKSKNKKKKNRNQRLNSENANGDGDINRMHRMDGMKDLSDLSNLNNMSMDMEVEKFKQSLLNSSGDCKLTKIVPKFTKEWIDKIKLQ